MQPIETAILKTMSYFDIFDYPLTAVEIWKWLYVDSADDDLRALKLNDVRNVLDESDILRSKIETRSGFYYLNGRDEIISERMDRYRFAERKFHRAKRVVKLLRLIPFIKMIGVCNTLGYSNSRRSADIDLFIITKRRRTWQVRFWVVGFLKLFNMRPRPEAMEDTICPSFFIDEDHCNIEEFAIPNDIYLPYWVAQVVPLYDAGRYSRFISENRWVREKLPHFIPASPPSRRRVSPRRIMKGVANFVFSFLPERLFRRYQMKIMPSRLQDAANQDSRVVVNDSVLKFHDNDRRAQYLERWRERIGEVL